MPFVGIGQCVIKDYVGVFVKLAWLANHACGYNSHVSTLSPSLRAQKVIKEFIDRDIAEHISVYS